MKEKKAVDVNVNKETFDLISNMCAIQPSMIFEKKDGKILVNRANGNQSIVFRMNFPESHFSFNGDEVCFLNFPEFYQLYCVLNAPKITQVVDNTHEMFVLSENTSKIKYLISDPESLKKGPENIEWSDPDAVVKLTANDLKELKKAIGLVEADMVRFVIKQNENLSMNITRGPNDNSFEKSFPLAAPASSDFSLAIEAEFFQLIPDNECLLEINKEGLIRLSFTKNNVAVELFTGEVQED